MVQIFATGGTFDKEYDYLTGKLFFENSHLNKMFERGRSVVPINITTLMMLDSLEMTDADREIIAHNCLRTEHTRVIITHGTDRMVETATYLAQRNIPGKTIVLMGAMIPFAFGTSSDGFFNLGCALGFVQCQTPGVYVVMNGRCFDWNNVRKNRKTGFFEELTENN